MKLQVPFDADPDYVQLLNNLEVHSVYYGLAKGLLPDARNTTTTLKVFLIDGLKKLNKNINKYLVMNGVFVDPALYSMNMYKKRIEEELTELVDNNVLDGIIIFDMYLLQIISTFDLVKTKRIKIIPSINFKIDSIDRLNSISTQIENVIGYKPHFELIHIDRSLNRNISKLKELSEYIRNYYPEAKISLLANEGCINHCSFKHTHDSIISVLNFSQISNSTITELKESGCYQYFKNKPKAILNTPFIRPEDLDKYEPYCDVIKLSGRTLSPFDKWKIIQAYSNKKYNFNLLDILEVQTKLKEEFVIDNDEFPEEFLSIVTSCDKNCSNCHYCEILAEEIIHPKLS